METRSVNTRPETFVQSNQPKNLTTSEEKPNQSQVVKDLLDESSKAAGTVTFSDGSLKLAATASVNKAEQSNVIETNAQAQQKLNQLLAGFQKNPTQALSAQNDILPSITKALLA